MAEIESLPSEERQRKLASIQVIDKIVKHPNADALELALILGWQVVIRTNEAKAGDVVVYCEIDSMLPGNAEWLPLAVKGRVEQQSNQSWYRVKTIALRKELSQGLIIPITDSLREIVKDASVGDDVTEQLGIQKYERSTEDSNVASDLRKFPTELLNKTEELRIQSRPYYISEISGLSYYASLKLDGTSATYLINPLKTLIDEIPLCDASDVSDDFWYARPEHSEIRMIESLLANYIFLNKPNIDPKIISLYSCIRKDLITRVDKLVRNCETRQLIQEVAKNIYNSIKKKMNEGDECDEDCESFMEVQSIMKVFDESKVEEEFMVCSRNTVKEIDSNDEYWEMAKKYNIEEKLRKLISDSGRYYAIQGEICGPKIQKNPLNLKENDFFVFNIVDITPFSGGRKKLPLAAFIDFCKKLELRTVPIIESKDHFEYESVKELLKKAELKYSEFFNGKETLSKKKNHVEGVVYRTKDQSISFKVINNLFLLKGE